MFGLTPVHLIIILVVVLLVVGPGKLPEVGAALGKSIREFRNATGDIRESVQLDAPAAPTPPAQPASTPLGAPEHVASAAPIDTTKPMSPPTNTL